MRICISDSCNKCRSVPYSACPRTPAPIAKRFLGSSYGTKTAERGILCKYCPYASVSTFKLEHRRTCSSFSEACSRSIRRCWGSLNLSWNLVIVVK
ncbi:hypothetical protein HN011_000039 [Eciton burchellii]|nr:hypothetical protein HN011_000039 [Eciton burchellii]